MLRPALLACSSFFTPFFTPGHGREAGARPWRIFRARTIPAPRPRPALPTSSRVPPGRCPRQSARGALVRADGSAVNAEISVAVLRASETPRGYLLIVRE